jgi:hypothetical protein
MFSDAAGTFVQAVGRKTKTFTDADRVTPQADLEELKEIVAIRSKNWIASGQTMAFDASQTLRSRSGKTRFGNEAEVRAAAMRPDSQGRKRRYVDLAYTPAYLKERKELGRAEPIKEVTDQIRAVRDAQIKIAKTYQEILSQKGVEAARDFAASVAKAVKGKPMKTKANVSSATKAADIAYTRIMNQVERTNVDQMLADIMAGKANEVVEKSAKRFTPKIFNLSGLIQTMLPIRPTAKYVNPYQSMSGTQDNPIIATDARPSNDAVTTVRDVNKAVDAAEGRIRELGNMKSALRLIHENKVPVGKAGEEIRASVKAFFNIEKIPKDLFDLFEIINKQI